MSHVQTFFKLGHTCMFVCVCVLYEIGPDMSGSAALSKALGSLATSF